MKKLHFVFLGMFLVACSVERTVSPTQQRVIEQTSTLTAQLAVSTSTPSLTPDPTETPDPNIPAGVKVGTENGMRYYEVQEGGKLVRYRKYEFKNPNNDVLFSGWTKFITSDAGYPMWDSPQPQFNLVPLRVLVDSSASDGQILASVIHDDVVDYNDLSPLDSIFTAELAKRIFHKDASTLSQDEWGKFQRDLSSGNAFLPLTDAFGNSIQGRLSQDSGFVSIITNYDQLVNTKGATSWHDENNFEFYSMVLGIDSNGNIIGLIASKTPLSRLSEKQLRRMIFYHVGMVLTIEDQTTQYFVTLVDAFGKYSQRPRADGEPDWKIIKNP